jgi:C4-dicarboxylate-specific signal transduction histidine kinase
MSTPESDVDRLLSEARVALAGSVLGPLGHEINNLVQGLSAAEFLIRDCLDNDEPVDADDLDQLKLAIGDLKAMAAHLQHYARTGFEAPEELDVHAELQRALEFLRTAGITTAVEVEVNSQGPAAAIWSRGELNLLLTALLANAAEGARQGASPRMRITFEPGEADMPMQLIIENSGAEPIAGADQPFVSSKPPHRHVGLGLTACRAIAARRGASLSVEAGTDGGARTTLRLPRRCE